MKLGIVGLPTQVKALCLMQLQRQELKVQIIRFVRQIPTSEQLQFPMKGLMFWLRCITLKSYPNSNRIFGYCGLVRGASKGEGLGNKFLSHIREVDAIIHVVRCFDDNDIVHVEGSVDPIRDIETINLELVFSDMEAVEKRIEKTRKQMKSGDKKYLAEINLLERIKETLDSGKPVRSMVFDSDEAEYVNHLFLLTSKPVMYCANVSEDGISSIDQNPYVAKVREIAATENSEVIVICAKIEEEIAQLDDDEKQMFLDELGLMESGLDKLIKASYKLLGLISFLTAGEPEVRAQTIVKGTKAPQAAGKIHSDFERGFIRAEVVAYDDLIRCGSHAAAKEQGLVRSEGKEYIMQDGDVTLFRFNV